MGKDCGWEVECLLPFCKSFSLSRLSASGPLQAGVHASSSRFLVHADPHQSSLLSTAIEFDVFPPQIRNDPAVTSRIP